MTIKQMIKKIWANRKLKAHHAEVHEKVYADETLPAEPQTAENVQTAEVDVDLSPQKDLENYARGLSVSKKSLEQLISSGMLMPDELEVAEKIIRFMRNRDKGSDY